MRRRILPLLLAVAMVLSMIPVTASAAGEGTASGTYAKAADFLAQADEQGEITLSGDVTLTEAVDVTQNLTINLAGHTITSAAKYTLWAEGGATLTIKGNGTENPGTVENTNTTAGFALVAAPFDYAGNAKLVVDGGAEVKNASTGGDATIMGYKKSEQTGTAEIELLDCEVTSEGPIGVTIRDGKLTVGQKATTDAEVQALAATEAKQTVIKVSGKKAGKDVGAIDVENSTVNFVNGTVTSDSYGIAVAGKSTVNVTGGSITGTVGIGTNGSTTDSDTVITVSGGTVTGSTKGAGVYLPAGKLNVTGGTVSGGAGIIVLGGSLTVGDGATVTATGKGTVEVGDSGHSVPAAGIVVDEAAGGYPTIDDVTVSAGATVEGGVAYTGEGGPRVDPLQGARLDATNTKYNEEGYFEIVIDQSNIGPSTSSGTGSGATDTDGFWVGIGIIAPKGYDTLKFARTANATTGFEDNHGNSTTHPSLDAWNKDNSVQEGFAVWLDAAAESFKEDGVWYTLEWSADGKPTVREVYHIKLGNVSLAPNEIVPSITEVGFKADATAATEAVKKAAESVGKTGEACMSNTMWVAFKLNSGAEIAAGKKVKVEFKRGGDTVCEGELDTTAKTTGGYACFSFDNASQIEPGATLAEGEYTITVTCGNNKSVKTLDLYKVTFTAENGTIANNEDGFAMLEDVDSVAKPKVTPNPGYTDGAWGDGVTNEEAHTVTYKYTCEPDEEEESETATVTFDPAPGEWADDSAYATSASITVTITNGAIEIDTLPAATDVKEREGFTLAGWKYGEETYTDEDLPISISNVSRGDTFTFTAVWEEDEPVVDPDTPAVKVTYSFGEGVEDAVWVKEPEKLYTPAEDTKEVKFNLPVATDVKRPGYTLTGWTDSVDGSHTLGEEITESNVTALVELTFTAVWKQNEITVELDPTADGTIGQGVKGAKQTETGKHYGDVITLPAVTHDNEFCILTGWTCDAEENCEGHTETYTIPDVADGATITLTAQWVEVKVTVTLAAGEGATFASGVTTSFTNLKPGAQVTLPTEEDFEITEGYTFNGWKSSLNETIAKTETTYTVPAGIVETTTITLTAQWLSAGNDEPTPPSPDEEPTFKDVPATSYFFNAVEWGVANKIVSGVTNTTFEPDGLATRAQFVAFLWRASGRPEPETKVNPFTDVKESDYFYKAVLWGVENKIVSGTSATTFSPNSTCNRAQAVTFLWRHAGRPNATGTTAFTDVPANQYYSTAVAWGAAKKYVAGTSDTTFSPNSTCTRAQAVTFLYRYRA